MNDFLSAILLLAVPGVPLLLTIPALRSRLAWPCHLALLPALILLAVPEVFPVEFPWLLFGSGLGIDGASRLLLAVSVVLWATTATLLQSTTDQPASSHRTSFFLFTLSGNLGAILATDLVGFFAFSTLMGFSFYGLLVTGGNQGLRRTGRIYLAILVLADLALFEALLLAAATTNNLGFSAVGQAIARSPSVDLYLWMVFTGFAPKAGLWPVHFWLPMAFRWSQPAVALLLGGVPVAMGLLGMLRWLPLGEITALEAGWIFQGLAVTALLYAIVAGILRFRRAQFPAYVTLFATGLFTIAIGQGMVNPALWLRYGHLTQFFITALGLGLAGLTLATSRLVAGRKKLATPAVQAVDSIPWLERWAGTVLAWGARTGLDTLPRWRTAWQAKLAGLWQNQSGKRMLDTGERALQRWICAITLFLLLGIVVALVGASFWLQ